MRLRRYIDSLEKIASIVEPDKIWEYNHSRITEVIRNYISKFSSMPGKTAIAEATSLSLKTVHKLELVCNEFGSGNSICNAFCISRFKQSKHSVTNLQSIHNDEETAAMLYSSLLQFPRCPKP